MEQIKKTNNQKMNDLVIVLNFKLLLNSLKDRVSERKYTHRYIYNRMEISKSKYFRLLNGQVADFDLLIKFIEIVYE